MQITTHTHWLSENTPFIMRLLAPIVLVVFSGCANGKHDEPAVEWLNLVGRSDANENGTIEIEELERYLVDRTGRSADIQQAFTQYDRDGDGSITRAEFTLD